MSHLRWPASLWRDGRKTNAHPAAQPKRSTSESFRKLWDAFETVGHRPCSVTIQTANTKSMLGNSLLSKWVSCLRRNVCKRWSRRKIRVMYKMILARVSISGCQDHRIVFLADKHLTNYVNWLIGQIGATQQSCMSTKRLWVAWTRNHHDDHGSQAVTDHSTNNCLRNINDKHLGKEKAALVKEHPRELRTSDNVRMHGWNFAG